MIGPPVVITGVGLVTPLGQDPATVVDRLLAGETAVQPVEIFDASPFPCSLGAWVKGFKARDWVDNRKNLKLMSTAVRIGLGACQMAARDAGVAAGPELDPGAFGMFVGAGSAFGDTRDLAYGVEAIGTGDDFDLCRFAKEGMSLVNPLWLLKGLSNNVHGFASAALDAQGINQNYCNSGVGGLMAIGEAAYALAEGRAEVIIAGGADSAVNPEHFTGFGRLNMLTEARDASGVRAFDRRRDGFAPGVGAAFVVLETAERAARRGARPLARVAGYGTGTSVMSLTRGEPSTIVAIGRRALETAGWRPEEVDVVYAHGSANPAFDMAEARAFSRLFGEPGPAITTQKAQLGHAIAAAGAISLVVAIEAGRRGQIPFIAGLEQLDAACAGPDFVRSPREALATRALIHSAGLGGQSTFVAIEVAP